MSMEDLAKQAREWTRRLFIHLSNNATVEFRHTQKHLCLQLDSKLSFSKHINFKISKVTKGIGPLRKLWPILTCKSLAIIYKSSTRYRLDCKEIIHDQPSNASFSNKIGSVQRNPTLVITEAITLRSLIDGECGIVGVVGKNIKN